MFFTACHPYTDGGTAAEERYLSKSFPILTIYITFSFQIHRFQVSDLNTVSDLKKKGEREEC